MYGIGSITCIILFVDIDCNMLCMQSAVEKSKPEEIMQSTTDAADWKLEVERVLPQLKVTIRTDNKVS